MRLNVKAFALMCGIMWGLGLFILTWWIIAFEGATGDVTMIGRLYRGYNISPHRKFYWPDLGFHRWLDCRGNICVAL